MALKAFLQQACRDGDELGGQELEDPLELGIRKETLAKITRVKGPSIDLGGAKEGMLVGMSACRLKSTSTSSVWGGDVRLIEIFSQGKLKDALPLPVGETLKGGGGMETLLLLVRDTVEKMNGKLGVKPPEVMGARGEPDTTTISSTCSTRGDLMRTSKD